MPRTKKQSKQNSDDEIVQKKEFRKSAKQVLQEYYNLDISSNSSNRSKYMQTKVMKMDLILNMKQIEELFGFKEAVYCCFKISEVMIFRMRCLNDDVSEFNDNLQDAIGSDGKKLFKQLKKNTAKLKREEDQRNGIVQERQKNQRPKTKNEEDGETKQRQKRTKKPNDPDESIVQKENLDDRKLPAEDKLRKIYQKMGLPLDMDSGEEDNIMHLFSPDTRDDVFKLRAQRLVDKSYNEYVLSKSSDEDRLRILSRQQTESDDQVNRNRSSGEDSNREPILNVTQLNNPQRQRIQQSDHSEIQEKPEFPKSKYEIQQERIHQARLRKQEEEERMKKERAEKRAAKQGQPGQPKPPPKPANKLLQYYQVDQDIYVNAKKFEADNRIQNIDRYQANFQFQRMADEQARDTEKIRQIAEKHNQEKAEKDRAKRREEAMNYDRVRNKSKSDIQDPVPIRDIRDNDGEQDVSFKNKAMTLKAEIHHKVIKFNQFAEKSKVLFGDSKAQSFYSLMIMARTGQAKIEDKNKNRYKFSDIYIQL